VENRRQALSSAGDSLFDDDQKGQWRPVLGDVDMSVVETFAQELQYMVDRLGAQNARLGLVQLTSKPEISLNEMITLVGSSCQVFEISKGSFVILYAGPKTSRELLQALAKGCYVGTGERSKSELQRRLDVRSCEVFSHTVVEPIAVLSELANCSELRLKEFL